MTKKNNSEEKLRNGSLLWLSEGIALRITFAQELTVINNTKG